MPKPNEFHVGVLDLFAILLPGAIATAILAPHRHLIIDPLSHPPTGEAGTSSEAVYWASFIICAYFVGHIIFLFASYIDGWYDDLREYRRLNAKKNVNEIANERARKCATEIRESYVSEDESKAFNTFQWSRSVLILVWPVAAEDVHRLEADSKFFRSLLPICPLAAIVFAVGGHWIEGIVALALVVPCFARYYERRLKSTTQAYIHIVVLHRLGRLQAAAKPFVA